MESIQLKELPIGTTTIDPTNHSEPHHSLPQPITHSPWDVSSMLTSLPYVRNIDPLQQLKNFVKPFRGIDTDDVVQWIESVIHFFNIIQLPGIQERLHLQYAPALLQDYAYKWWVENKAQILDWSTFTRLLIQRIGG